MFNNEACNKFLQVTGCTHLVSFPRAFVWLLTCSPPTHVQVRAHEKKDYGIAIQNEGKILTVFSTRLGVGVAVLSR
jgi:hypothetical protein